MPFDPFRIEFLQRAIDDLHRRIDATRWPDLAHDPGWTEGANDAVLRDLVRYWRNDYDWFAMQDALNGRTHLRGEVEGEAMHVMLATGPGGGERMPLLLLHGWPGSFIEFLDAANRLSEGVDGVAFDLVVPSLPGFGFSDAPSAAGLHPGRIAELMHLLMQELGYERYGVQGGDCGAIIGTALASRHPEALTGLHLNFTIGGPPPADGEMSEEEQEWRKFRQDFEREETEYSRIQGTRPQSLAYAQQDSPVGFLAWMLEKFWVWTDHGDDLWDAVDRDWLLTNAMLYWLTGKVLSAARIYYETSHMSEPLFIPPIEVPMAYAKFPAEAWAAPREVVERVYNLVQYTEAPQGGHFAAMEQPEFFASDVAAFFSTRD